MAGGMARMRAGFKAQRAGRGPMAVGALSAGAAKAGPWRGAGAGGERAADGVSAGARVGPPGAPGFRRRRQAGRGPGRPSGGGRGRRAGRARQGVELWRSPAPPPPAHLLDRVRHSCRRRREGPPQLGQSHDLSPVSIDRNRFRANFQVTIPMPKRRGKPCGRLR